MKPHWSLLVLLIGLLLGSGCRATATMSPTQAPPTATSPPTAAPPPSPQPVPTLPPVERSVPDTPLDPFVQARRLGRGVNLGNALEAPTEGAWGMVIQPAYLKLIREAGFDTVRVPIRWSAHASSDTPYTVDPAFFARVDWVIDEAFAQDLNVVINMHHYDEIFERAGEHRERFLAIWRQIAIRYKDMPDNLYLEPLNEPHDNLTAGRWNGLLAEVVDVIRQVDGVHTLILGGAEWGGVNALGKLRLQDDENVILTFHFYDPFLFTHQGAEWVGPEYHTVGVQWPGPPAEPLTPIPEAEAVGWIKSWFQDYNTVAGDRNPAGPRPIQKQLDWAVRWGERLGKPLWMGEFGAYSKADMRSRVNWTTFVRQEAEARGITWAYWEFGAGFGVYDREAQRWNEDLLRALVPE